MERLLKKIESMSLEEFNGMMVRFIDRTKKVINLAKLFDAAKKQIEKEDNDLNRFLKERLSFDDNLNFYDPNLPKQHGNFYENINEFIRSSKNRNSWWSFRFDEDEEK